MTCRQFYYPERLAGTCEIEIGLYSDLHFDIGREGKGNDLFVHAFPTLSKEYWYLSWNDFIPSMTVSLV